MSRFSTKSSFLRAMIGIALLIVPSGYTQADDNQKTLPDTPLSHAPITPLQSSFTLQAGCPILVAADAPQPVRRALQDLQRDLKNVLGVASPIVSSSSELEGQSGIVVVGPESTWPKIKNLRNPAVKGWEAHGVFVREINGKPQVVLQGADLRGTLYAIYSFSEKFLGVPPLYYWSSWQPVKRINIEVPRATNQIFASTTVKWRTWFPNDTDLLTPWENRSEENFQAIYETMLRLKLNVLEGWTMGGDPGVSEGVFDEHYRAGRDALVARDRGLAFTGHHINPLGAAYWHWDAYWKKIRHQEPPKLSVKNLPALREFWRYHVETAKREHIEMIWLVGFRGVRDEPFWESFADAPKSSEERARLINQMMAEQIKLFKEITGEKAPTLRVTLYNEMSEFFERGLVKLPNEPNLICAFANDRRDHFPSEDIRQFKFPAGMRVGYYMNLQYTGTGSHLAQGESPWKMEGNYRMVQKLAPNGLEFSVVNAGNIREFVLELSANARMMWDSKTYDSNAFLNEFCVTYFGTEHATEIAHLYRAFYGSYWQQRKPNLPDFERQFIFHDLRYSQALRTLITGFSKPYNPNPFTDRESRYFAIVPEDSGETTQVDAVIKCTSESIQKLEVVLQTADRVKAELPPEKRAFFNDNLRVQARFMLRVNQALLALTLASKNRDDAEKRSEYLRQALSAVNDIKPVLAEAEHDQFANWFDSEFKFRITNIQVGLKKLQ